jgi:hypothetical protein
VPHIQRERKGKREILAQQHPNAASDATGSSSEMLYFASSFKGGVSLQPLTALVGHVSAKMALVSGDITR